jgi:hypothetical protein
MLGANGNRIWLFHLLENVALAVVTDLIILTGGKFEGLEILMHRMMLSKVL